MMILYTWCKSLYINICLFTGEFWSDHFTLWSAVCVAKQYRTFTSARGDDEKSTCITCCLVDHGSWVTRQKIWPESAYAQWHSGESCNAPCLPGPCHSTTPRTCRSTHRTHLAQYVHLLAAPSLPGDRSMSFRIGQQEKPCRAYRGSISIKYLAPYKSVRCRRHSRSQLTAVHLKCMFSDDEPLFFGAVQTT